MKYVNSAKLLLFFAIGGMITTTGVILIQGMFGLYCLIATSAFMSLMFPTIYGIALDGIIEDEGRPALPDGLYLRAGQGYSRFKAFLDEVVMISLPVGGDCFYSHD